MKIASYDVTQKASSSFTRIESTKTKYEAYVTIGNASVNPDEKVSLGSSDVLLSLSDDLESVDTTKVDDLFHLSDADKEKIRLLEHFISAITGKKFKFQQILKLDEDQKQKHNQIDNSGLSVSFGGKFMTTHRVSEQETMRFESKGVVQTEDGQTIDFKVNLNMARSYQMTSTTTFEIGGSLQDPLVFNFDGKGIEFGEDSLQLDITLNGSIDTFRNLAYGSGFLALDHNGNGQIDDGSELFGPKTGSGFNELRAYDQDGNQWIDENDDIFDSLKIWSVKPDGSMTLIGLKETGVGAIYLGDVATTYHMKEDGAELGRLKQSSVYLKENGGAGAIHEIDLKL